ncbi:MAG: AMMECR1 domain-containing protein, partial [Deltaproteobacteria bacterium]|nr:AMMECR1 domain-containing protein [Deltaproteobacteria bacterium]
IGRTQGITPTLTQEVAECAIMAATRDTRFTPLRDTLELQNLSIELSLLMPLEEISSTASLDPHRYGVVVMAGSKRGLLLPNVDGIETVEKQLQIAKEKGKIDAHEECQLARFEVLKITEQDAPA